MKPSKLTQRVLQSSSALYWEPDRVKLSAWMTHVPFAFWLIDVIRPKVIVELGTHTGVSYAAMCQAVDELGFKARTYAVDTWEGDDQAGFYDETVYDDIVAFNKGRFSHFSELLRMTFNDASERFEDGSIDLLHIDGCHTYEAVTEAFHAWKGKLSSSGVVMFHDTAEFKEDFGVHQLWDELKDQYPSFEFKHGHGLGVLAVGAKVPRMLIPLMNASKDKDATQQIRQAFQRLGDGLDEKQKVVRRQIELERVIESIDSNAKTDDAARNRAISSLAERVIQQNHQIKNLDEKINLRDEAAASLTDLYNNQQAYFEKIDSLAEEYAKISTSNMRQEAISTSNSQHHERNINSLLALETRLTNFEILSMKMFSRVLANQEAAHPKNALSENKNGLFSSINAALGRRLAPFGRLITKFNTTQDRKLIAASNLFDAEYYLIQYPDVARSKIDPLKHFITFGWREHRQASREFNTSAYLKAYPDVAKARLNPLVHYIKTGRALGYSPNPAGQSIASVKPTLGSNTKKSDGAGVRSTVANAQSKTYSDGNKFDWRATTPLLDDLFSGGIIDELPDDWRSKAQLALKTFSPTISVVIPTWNRATVVSKAIDSALGQSYAPYEVIISDDGSTDDTLLQIRAHYADEISAGQIKIVENKHEGVSAARNSGLALCEGDLIAYLDSDNTWRKDFLFVMAALFAQNDELHTAYASLAGRDLDNEKSFVRSTPYDRNRLLDGNFIDLNIFVHTRQVYQQFGGFDTKLKRLVDWDLIVKYTRLYMPAFVPFIGVDYVLDHKSLQNITTTVPLDENRFRVYQNHLIERLGKGRDNLRLAYFAYDFPATSQTFVMNELRWLVENGVDVIVYFAVEPDKSAKIDFPLTSKRVKDADELAALLGADNRNMCHSHFAYPGITNFVWPACELTGIKFTFFPHAVDIFHEANVKRNRIDEVVKSDSCLRVFVYGDHHREFLEAQGVPRNKISYNFQVPGLHSTVKKSRSMNRENGPLKGLVIARFIEKKGISYLIDALAMMTKNQREKMVINIYGYGPEEDDYKKQITKHKLQDHIKLLGGLDSNAALQQAYTDNDFVVAPCVIAKNGDRDGFPTVILDAINEGMPVVTTAVSGISDYLNDGVEAIVVPEKDPTALAEGLNRLVSMSAEQSNALVARAQNFTTERANIENTMGMYFDWWLNRSVDIFLVSYNTAQYDDIESSREIIRRIIERTTTPYTLTIVDNGSEAKFQEMLLELSNGNSNIRLLRKRENIFCGPASNVAIGYGDAQYAIYVCSKEGFIMQQGWERSFIQYLDRNADVAQAGHKVHLPSATYGKEMHGINEFNFFRNKDFVESNPDRSFLHVQGGLFVVRRDVFLSLGGFNNDTPQNNLDVEFSFMLEAQGWKTGKIPHVISLTKKTLPTFAAQFTDRTIAVHPSDVEECCNTLDQWVLKGHLHRCNICEWEGDKFNEVPTILGIKYECPNCQSSGLDRYIYAELASDHRAHRKNQFAALLSNGQSLTQTLGKDMFKKRLLTDDASKFTRSLKKAKEKFPLLIIDRDLIPDEEGQNALFWEVALSSLGADGLLLFSDRTFDETLDFDIEEYEFEWSDQSSQLLKYDWCRLGRIVN